MVHQSDLSVSSLSISPPPLPPHSPLFFIVLVLYWEVKPILGNPKIVRFWVGNTIPILYRPALGAIHSLTEAERAR